MLNQRRTVQSPRKISPKGLSFHEAIDVGRREMPMYASEWARLLYTQIPGDVERVRAVAERPKISADSDIDWTKPTQRPQL